VRARSTRSHTAAVNSPLSPIPSLLHETNQEIFNQWTPTFNFAEGEKTQNDPEWNKPKPKKQQRKDSNIPANVNSVIANEMKPIIVDAKLSGANPWGMVIWISLPLPFLLSKIKKEKNDSYLSLFFLSPLPNAK
jgi:hypothetical protein